MNDETIRKAKNYISKVEDRFSKEKTISSNLYWIPLEDLNAIYKIITKLLEEK